jgi:hypothetical protein
MAAAWVGVWVPGLVASRPAWPWARSRRACPAFPARAWQTRGGANAAAGRTLAPDSIVAQVERLIQQASAHENLAVAYLGWCAWW